MKTTSSFYNLLATLWAERCRTVDSASDLGKTLDLTADQLAVLAFGFRSALADYHLLDKVLRLYLYPAGPETEPELPADIRDRILRAGPGSLSPNELITLSVTPTWLAGLADALKDETPEWFCFDEDIDARYPARRLLGKRGIRPMQFLRSCIRREVRAILQLAPSLDSRSLADAVDDRLCGPHPLPLPQERDFFVMVGEEIRDSRCLLLREAVPLQLMKRNESPVTSVPAVADLTASGQSSCETIQASSSDSWETLREQLCAGARQPGQGLLTLADHSHTLFTEAPTEGILLLLLLYAGRTTEEAITLCEELPEMDGWNTLHSTLRLAQEMVVSNGSQHVDPVDAA